MRWMVVLPSYIRAMQLKQNKGGIKKPRLGKPGFFSYRKLSISEVLRYNTSFY